MDEVRLSSGHGEKLDYQTEKHDDYLSLTVRGRITRHTIPGLNALIHDLRLSTPRLVLNLEDAEAVDSSLPGLLLAEWKRKLQNEGVFEIGSISDSVRSALDMFSYDPEAESVPVEKKSFFEQAGESVLSSLSNFAVFLQLAADTTVGAIRELLRGGVLNWSEVTNQSIFIGSQALPIVALISLLIGLTLAFQSAFQLKAFGMDVFVAKFTAIAMVQEMGPLMTAILVAGRSGSSIAAEMATMKVSEEIDALQVMGIDPSHYLAIPRLVAIVVTVPLLTICAIFIGIIGGFLVAVYYVGLAPVSYIMQTLEAFTVQDLISGVCKSIIFAWGIGLIGLFYGFQVRGGAEEVGKATTTSVVASIFYIIVADCVFSIIFYVVL